MKGGKLVADLLTLSRLLLACAFVPVGILRGDGGLAIAGWMMIYSWTSDILDGAFARSAGEPQHTWLGDNDLLIDMSVSLGLLFYMMLSGYVGLYVGVLYLVAWALAFWRFGLTSSLGKLFQTPIYGWFLLISLRHAPIAGWSMLAWIVIAIWLSWPRFPNEVIPGFLDGFGEGEQGNELSGKSANHT